VFSNYQASGPGTLYTAKAPRTILLNTRQHISPHSGSCSLSALTYILIRLWISHVALYGRLVCVQMHLSVAVEEIQLSLLP
jgi:hypothetical protein